MYDCRNDLLWRKIRAIKRQSGNFQEVKRRAGIWNSDHHSHGWENGLWQKKRVATFFCRTKTKSLVKLEYVVLRSRPHSYKENHFDAIELVRLARCLRRANVEQWGKWKSIWIAQDCNSFNCNWSFLCFRKRRKEYCAVENIRKLSIRWNHRGSSNLDYEMQITANEKKMLDFLGKHEEGEKARFPPFWWMCPNNTQYSFAAKEQQTRQWLLSWSIFLVCAFIDEKRGLVKLSYQLASSLLRGARLFFLVLVWIKANIIIYLHAHIIKLSFGKNNLFSSYFYTLERRCKYFKNLLIWRRRNLTLCPRLICYSLPVQSTIRAVNDERKERRKTRSGHF